jgi:hypothetical protein
MDDFDVDHGLDRAEVAHVEPHRRCPLSQNAALNGSSPACVASIGKHDRPRHQTCRIRSQEHHNCGDFIGFAQPGHRRSVDPGAEHRLIVLGISGKRSVDIGRRHGVNAQAMSRKLGGVGSDDIDRRMIARPVSYKRHRFPSEIIAHAVWLYFRFPLSLRLVEEMLLERGIVVSYETIRRWAIKFGAD